MANDTTSNGADVSEAVSEAVDLLREFGLTEYEAKCFTALVRIDNGTAKEVSEVADIPQARVYDSMDSLHERGLADIQESSPRRFRAVTPEEAVRTFERRYSDRLDRLGDLLPRLEPPEGDDDDGEVWVTEGGDDVTERLTRLAETAGDEILLAVAEDDLLSADLLDALRGASERGVAITVGSPAEPIREALRDGVPDAEVRETWTWWETYPIQDGAVSSIMLVDGGALLVSAEHGTSLPGVRTHRAVWTRGSEAPLVGMIEPLLAQAITGPGAAPA